jgi:CubicO group peptidase (beta-lactamase class C family)
MKSVGIGPCHLVVLVLLVQILLDPSSCAGAPDSFGSVWPTDQWTTTSPEDQGMNSTVLKAMDDYVAEREYALHGLVVARHGVIVHESYPDFRYNGETRHRLYSVTKSVGSILVGIAIDHGYILSIHERVIDYFPDYTIANLDPWKESMTLEHLLTMTCGVEWWEWGYPLEDPRNSYYNYSLSEDHIQYFLDLPMQYEPGTVWVYNSPSVTILSHILYRATGMTPLQFAEEYLFSKLGIQAVYWLTDTFGIECMSGALYLTPREMAKIGQLMLMNGTWNGEQIVSEEWVSNSTTTQVLQPYHPLSLGYGYLWWISPGYYSAQGRFGQRIFVLPEQDIVVSFTCHLGEYLIQPWDYFIEEFIIPSLLGNATSTTQTAGGTRYDHSPQTMGGILAVLVVAILVLRWTGSRSPLT